MDALMLLREDHRKVKRLLGELETATGQGAKARAALISRIKDEISIHETLEEQILFPALEQHRLAHDIVRDRLEQHDVVDALVGELASLAPTDERWGPTATVMRQGIEHHVAEEERGTFDEAQRVLDAGELRQLGKEMADRKTTIQWQMSRYR
jgi:hemerythrin-like domain-containing protein